MNCLFCKIINRDIKSSIVFENDNIIAFRDINPQAPVHILIIPKKHIASLNELENEDKSLMGEIQLVAKALAKSEKIDANGYRLVLNCGQDGGQAVGHIHYHLLGGRKLTWPPG